MAVHNSDDCQFQFPLKTLLATAKGERAGENGQERTGSGLATSANVQKMKTGQHIKRTHTVSTESIRTRPSRIWGNEHAHGI